MTSESAPAHREGERVLATVLFTDIVGSTDLASQIGDREWKELLETHHRVIRSHLERLCGREMDTAGDGFFAIFDSPDRGIECAKAIMTSLRELGIESEPRKLIRAVRGVELVEMKDYQLCCGFGGTFSVKFPEVSVAMGEDKIRAAAEAGAEVLVANDSGCLMHLAGVIHRRAFPLKTLHIAELLAKRE